MNIKEFRNAVWAAVVLYISAFNPAHAGSQSIKYLRDGKLYSFTYGSSTYTDVVCDIGTPKYATVDGTGNLFATYRTIGQTLSNGQTPIIDSVFTFDANKSLVAERSYNKTDDPEPQQDLSGRQDAGASAPTSDASGEGSYCAGFMVLDAEGHPLYVDTRHRHTCAEVNAQRPNFGADGGGTGATDTAGRPPLVGPPAQSGRPMPTDEEPLSAEEAEMARAPLSVPDQPDTHPSDPECLYSSTCRLAKYSYKSLFVWASRGSYKGVAFWTHRALEAGYAPANPIFTIACEHFVLEGQEAVQQQRDCAQFREQYARNRQMRLQADELAKREGQSEIAADREKQENKEREAKAQQDILDAQRRAEHERFRVTSARPTDAQVKLCYKNTQVYADVGRAFAHALAGHHVSAIGAADVRILSGAKYEDTWIFYVSSRQSGSDQWVRQKLNVSNEEGFWECYIGD